LGVRKGGGEERDRVIRNGSHPAFPGRVTPPQETGWRAQTKKTHSPQTMMRERVPRHRGRFKRDPPSHEQAGGAFKSKFSRTREDVMRNFNSRQGAKRTMSNTVREGSQRGMLSSSCGTQEGGYSHTGLGTLGADKEMREGRPLVDDMARKIILLQVSRINGVIRKGVEGKAKK